MKFLMRSFLLIGYILFVSSLASAEECRTRCCEDEYSKLIVNGESKIETPADMVYFKIKLRVEEKKLDRAFELNTEKINAISDILKMFNITKDSIQNLGYVYHPLYEGKALFSSIQKPTSYEIIYTLKITVTKLQDLGKILTRLSEISETSISGLTYTSSKMDELRQEAMKKAASDARQKALKLAEGAGSTLGKTMKIESTIGLNSNNNDRVDQAYDGMLMKYAQTEQVKASPEIESGFIQIKATATVTYALSN